MFLVTNRLMVNDGWGEELERRFENRAGQIENEPGFVRMSVMRPVMRRKNPKTGEWSEVDGPGTYLIQTWWQDEDSFWGWTKSESFKAAHRDKPPEEMYAGPAKLEMHEVASDSSA